MPFPPPPFRLRVALGLCLLLALLLFTRSPTTNFVFDEQEALLANPYVQGQGGYFSAFSVDFWGRLPGETIGSYRPLPNLLWRPLAFTLRSNSPFFFHLLGVVTHALVGALLGAWVRRESEDDWAAWGAALVFTGLALSTEVVCSAVGLADSLAGLACVLLLLATSRRDVAGESWRVSFSAWGAAALLTSLGLFAKETMLSVLLPVALWPWLRRPRPSRVVRFLLPLALALGVLAYVVVRSRYFVVTASHTDTALSQLPGIGPAVVRGLETFGQPRLVADPINNPLAGLGFAQRLPTVAAVFAAGWGQWLVPLGLSADYSFAATRVVGWSFVAMWGLASFFAFSFVGGWLAVTGSSPRARLAGWALSWIPLTQLWVCNALVILPTVRADRLWYLPSIGFAVLAGLLVSRLCRRASQWPSQWPSRWVGALAALYLGIQAFAARTHALDYSDDLSFWEATARAVPESAKAQLNWGVMLGARGRLAERIERSRRAVELAPDWPMGRVYLADALCRAERPTEAWPQYLRGLELGHDQSALVALSLQCLWDHHAFASHEAELLALADRYPGSWLTYLAYEVAQRGELHGGVPKAQRPRGYNQKVR
ncbi:MAG TPA: hypothetical protein VLC09_15535 [Polyangiaceae bacterium]|nr:hypothetical protein [Polyangiaceae bacterium]